MARRSQHADARGHEVIIRSGRPPEKVQGAGMAGNARTTKADGQALVPLAKASTMQRVRVLVHSRARQRGMVTAEYAVGAVAAAGFAGVLIKVLTDPRVFDLLLRIISWLLGLVTGQSVL
jgi:hypothetical protein